MTREGEVLILREHLATVDRLIARMERLRGRLAPTMPMTGDRLKGLGDDEDIDVLAFLKTYEQLEDTLGRTLKVIIMLMSFGKKERLSARDVTFRAVSLGILKDGLTWADAVRLRNELAHEYPLHPEKQAAQVNGAWNMGAVLFETAEEIRNFVERERLLEGLL